MDRGVIIFGIIFVFLSLGVLITFYVWKKVLLKEGLGYLSIIDDGNKTFIFGRKTTNRETIQSGLLNKKTWDITPVALEVNHIKGGDIKTSISHAFMVNKIDNKFVAIAGRDPWLDIVHYKPGHDRGMYMFKTVFKNNFKFGDEKLIITKDTGAPQTYKSSNECFSQIIEINSSKSSNPLYYIFCRYNIHRGERKVQIFQSNDLKNWRLFKVLELYKNHKIIHDYSIYHMTVFYSNGLFVGLMRMALSKKFMDTNNHHYGLYSAYSNNGYQFHLGEKLLNFDYWPVAGSLKIEGDNYMIAHKTNGEAVLLKVVGKTLKKTDIQFTINL